MGNKNAKKQFPSQMKTFSLKLQDGTEVFVEVRVTALAVGK
jgi:hypothetical protein